MLTSTTDRMSPWVYRGWAAAVILVAAFARIFYLAWFSPLELAPDEAHYWDWSRQLDWSYYSKGPMIALVIRISRELFGPLAVAWTGSETLAVRLPAVVFGGLLTAALYVLTVQTWRRESWGLAVAVMAMTFPLVAAGSSLMTIDSPFTCLWAWTLVTGHAAVFGKRAWAWPTTGLLIALGILSKPTMVLWVPCFGLFLLATPSLRPLLVKRGFWILLVVASLGAVPLVAWNAANGWVTLRHTQSHAGVTAKQAIYLTGPLVYLGIQIALMFVYWFVIWAMALWKYRPWGDTPPEQRYLWWMSAPIFVFFGLFSLKNGGGEPNWPVVCYIAGMILALGLVNEQAQSSIAWRRRTTFAAIGLMAILGISASIVVHFPTSFQPVFVAIVGPSTPERPMPLRRIDPTVRLRGWSTLAGEVERDRISLRNQGIEPVVAAMSWSFPGELAFHLPDHPTVYCLGVAQGERHSQYNLWRPNPLADVESFRGKSFVIVGGSESFLSQAFETVEPPRVVEYREGDQLIAAWLITVAHGYRGFGVTQTPTGW